MMFNPSVPFASFNYMMTQYPMFGTFVQFLPLLLVIDIVLKGMALWRAGRNNQVYWFVALLIVNSIGILPIIYLLGFDERTKAPHHAVAKVTHKITAKGKKK